MAILRRHKIFYGILQPLVQVFLKLKFGYRYRIAKDLPDNYLVLSNHVTDYDPLLVGASFRKQMYFVASEHITRWGFAYTLLKYVFAPIIRYKGTVATNAVMDALRKLKKGHSVCIFAEGVRTWDGVTCPILPSTAKMVKTAGCALVTYKIEGGHFVSPGWCDHGTRRGYMTGGVTAVYTKEQLAAMSVDEIYQVIKRDLYEDAYARQLENPKPYRGKHLAEGLENMLFLCPECGARNSFTSHDDTMTCGECGLKFTYDAYAMLNGVRFRTVRDFAAWQREQVEADVAADKVYEVDFATLSQLEKHEATQIGQGRLSISRQALRCGEVEIPMDSISDMAIHGRHALVFSVNRKYYELLPAEEFSIQQFLQYFEACKK